MMKRTFLSLVSMAFICAVTLTSCDEIMSSMDNPVDSYLQVDGPELYVAEGSSIEVACATISDGDVTFTVADAKVAKVEKVEPHMAKVTGLKVGETDVIVKLAATEYYKAAEAKVKIIVKPTYSLKDAVVDGAKLKIGYKLNNEDCEFVYEFDGEKKVFNWLPDNSAVPQAMDAYDITMTYDENAETITHKVVSKENISDVPLVLNLYTGGSFDRVFRLANEMKSLQVNNYEMLPYVPESVTPVGILTPGLLPENMSVGDKGLYTIDILPANATNQVIKFTSSAPNVITIDAAGNFECVAEGKATIKAEATDGSGKFVEQEINVTAAELKKITLVPGVWDLDDARFAAYVWNGGGDKWYLFSKSDDKWTVSLPSSYTGLVLVRLNNTTEVSWDAKWNQTSDINLTAVDDKSTISITGWGMDDYTITSPTTTVTWNKSDITGSGTSFTKDGVTVTAGNIDWYNKIFIGGGTFTTSLGKFTKIEVTAANGVNGTGWSGNDSKRTWTGTASNSVSFNGYIDGMVGDLTIVFTIEPNS